MCEINLIFIIRTFVLMCSRKSVSLSLPNCTCTCTNNNIQSCIVICFRFMLAEVLVSIEEGGCSIPKLFPNLILSAAAGCFRVSARDYTIGVFCALQMPGSSAATHGSSQGPDTCTESEARRILGHVVSSQSASV